MFVLNTHTPPALLHIQSNVLRICSKYHNHDLLSRYNIYYPTHSFPHQHVAWFFTKSIFIFFNQKKKKNPNFRLPDFQAHGQLCPLSLSLSIQCHSRAKQDTASNWREHVLSGTRQRVADVRVLFTCWVLNAGCDELETIQVMICACASIIIKLDL